MKIVKEDSILDVSGKAYEVIYKEHGYTEYVEEAKKTLKKKSGEQSC